VAPMQNTAVEVRWYTDPVCSWSWGAEPAVRRLFHEFGEGLSHVWIMGGLARAYGVKYRDSEGSIGSGLGCFGDLMSHWLDASQATGMPCDPRIWTENPISSSYPVCMAVKAAAEQGPEAAYSYLRRVREGLMVERRKLDHAESLVAQAGPAGLDIDRFKIDLGSHAITEAFGADLEEAREIPAESRAAGQVRTTEGKERISFPSAVFIAADGSRRGVWGPNPYEAYAEAALAAGAARVTEEPLEPQAALERFGRAATRELVELSGRPGPVIEAELWQLAKEWELRPIPALTGTLWEKA
jgi:predicted DsbA family dithiol-disulfide isomerase